MKTLALAALVALASVILAVAPGEVQLLTPQSLLVKSGDAISLGAIGPGQTISFSADAMVTQGGLFGLGGRWDQLVVVQAPQGWTWSNSLEFEQPLKAKLTVAPDTLDGVYTVKAAVVDFGDKEKIGGNVSFDLKVAVSRDVMGLQVSPRVVITGAGQPAGYYVTLKNNGTANDVFEITSAGVPLWEFKKQVFVPAGSEKTVIYEVVSQEERDARIVIRAKSLSSPLIQKEENAKLFVQTSLTNDWKASGHGNLLFPVIEGPIYGLAGLISNLF